MYFIRFSESSVVKIMITPFSAYFICGKGGFCLRELCEII